MARILVTGALGQIGTELVTALRAQTSDDDVIASDIRFPHPDHPLHGGRFEHVDCTRSNQVQEVVRRFDVGTIYHLAALLSAVAEERPRLAWELNMGGLYRVLEVARQYGCAVFFPSSIGAFGPGTPRDDTPQDAIQRPNTMYGVTKVAGELVCDYYAHRFGVDARGVRLPGVISYAAPPGGGTTDYAVDIFHQAIRHGQYSCFLKPDTRLDMMYMPDVMKAITGVMAADPARLSHRNAYNVTAMNVTPDELAAEIRKHLPDFTMDYDVDPVRQAIADTWPRSLDDSVARQDWGWQPDYDLAAMTADMLKQLKARLRPGR